MSLNETIVLRSETSDWTELNKIPRQHRPIIDASQVLLYFR